MEYDGTVHLNRELSFSEAGRLTEFLTGTYTDRLYTRTGLTILADGRRLIWDGDYKIVNMEAVMADLMLLLTEMNIRACGIIDAKENDKKKFQIVILKNMVKVAQDGEIKNIISPMCT
jgi:hypothetical protein